MPKPSSAKDANSNRWRLPEVFPEDLTCVRVYVPNDIDYVNYLLGRLWTLCLQNNYNRDEAKTAKRVARLWRDAYQLTVDNLDLPCVYRGGSNFPYWSWLEDGGMKIEIHEDCEMPVYINIYEACCGEGDGEKSGGGAVGGGAGDGGGVDVSSSSSKCDVATIVVPYFISQSKELLENVRVAVSQGANLFDAFIGTAVDAIEVIDGSSNLIEEIVDLLEIQLDPLINALGDTDLILQTQVNWWGRTANKRFTSLTREDAIELGRSLPVAWNLPSVFQISSPRLYGEFVGRIIDLRKLNGQVQIARGGANQGLCAYLASENEENYDQPPDRGELVPEVVSIGDYRYYYYDAFDITEPNEEVVFKAQGGDSWLNIAAIRVERDVVTGAEPGGILLGDIGFPSETLSSNVGGQNKLLFQIGSGEPLDELAKRVAPGETNIIGVGLQGDRQSSSQIALGCGRGKPSKGTVNPILSVGIAVAVPPSPPN